MIYAGLRFLTATPMQCSKTASTHHSWGQFGGACFSSNPRNAWLKLSERPAGAPSKPAIVVDALGWASPSGLDSKQAHSWHLQPETGSRNVQHALESGSDLQGASCNHVLAALTGISATACSQWPVLDA